MGAIKKLDTGPTADAESVSLTVNSQGNNKAAQFRAKGKSMSIKGPAPHDRNAIPDLKCKYHVGGEKQKTAWQKFCRLTRLDTCFCFVRTFKGPKPGTKPNVIKLRSPGRDEAFDDDAYVKYPNNRPDNKIVSYKYTVWDFIFKATLIQFKRFVNAFYLAMAILSLIGISSDYWLVPYDPIGILLLLALVVGVTLIFEGVNDLGRHRADRRTNERPVEIMRCDGSSYITKWETLKPGDVIKLYNRDQVPADVVVLDTDTGNGICYIETSGIDGETNLKIKEVPKEFKERVNAEVPPAKSTMEIEGRASAVVHNSYGLYEYEEPNSLLQFAGRLIPDNMHRVSVGKPVNTKNEEIPLGFSNLILRGSELRNTAWIYAVVVYSGPETKLILSKSSTPEKFSLIDIFANYMVFTVFVIYLIIAVVSTLVLVLATPNTDELWYFQYVSSTDEYALPAGIAFLFTNLILFNGFIPVTLYLTLETSNFFQAALIGWDEKMYHEESDTAAVCRTSTLVSEIGQITHVFSDKTGTLTNNVMTLVGIFVDGKVYGYQPDDTEADTETTGSERDSSEDGSVRGNSLLRNDPIDVDSRPVASEKISGSPSQIPTEVLFADIIKTLKEKNETEEFKKVSDFLLLISLCHSVLVDYDDDGNIRYNAEGPDEEAFVKGAAKLGYRLIKSGNSRMTVLNEYTEQQLNYDILALNPFNSTRKRMSLVVSREENQGSDGSKMEYLLLMKGADNVMFDRMDTMSDPIAQLHERSIMEKQLLRYAWAGLRTMIMGKRVISPEEFTEWKSKYDQAARLPGSERSKALSEVAELIEKRVTLVGASAVEDELQVGVPDTIEILRDAGIRIWVATGDKVETAINIALAAKLIDSSMLQIKLISEDPATLIATIDENLALLKAAVMTNPANDIDADILSSRKGFEEAPKEKLKDVPKGFVADCLSIIISGKALENLLAEQKGDVETQEKLLQLANVCKIVVACRVSPAQKSLLVKMVGMPRIGDKESPVTLAIGDGANDVPMIQEARVGVGISGKEGLQAANSADFAIAQFRFLQSLLLVHGRWNYRRNSNLVIYVTYSWMVNTFLLFFYLPYSMWSGQFVFINPFYITCYGYLANIFIISTAWFNKDISRKAALNNPWTYVVGRRRKDLNIRKSLLMSLRAIFNAGIIWIGIVVMFPIDGGLEVLGAALYTANVWVMFQRQFALTKTWVWPSVLLFFLIILAFFIVMAILDDPPYIYTSYGASVTWLRTFWVVCLVGCSEVFFVFFQKVFFPTPLHILIEQDNGYFKGVKEKHDSAQKAIEVLRQAGQNAVAPVHVSVDRLQRAIRKRRETIDENDEKDKRLPAFLRPLKNFNFDFTYVGSGERRSTLRNRMRSFTLKRNRSDAGNDSSAGSANLQTMETDRGTESVNSGSQSAKGSIENKNVSRERAESKDDDFVPPSLFHQDSFMRLSQNRINLDIVDNNKKLE